MTKVSNVIEWIGPDFVRKSEGPSNKKKEFSGRCLIEVKICRAFVIGMSIPMMIPTEVTLH